MQHSSFLDSYELDSLISPPSSRPVRDEHQDDDGDMRASKGMLCPKCKCRYGFVVSVDLATQRTAVTCSVCEYRWFGDKPATEE